MLLPERRVLIHYLIPVGSGSTPQPHNTKVPAHVVRFRVNRNCTAGIVNILLQTIKRIFIVIRVLMCICCCIVHSQGKAHRVCNLWNDCRFRKGEVIRITYLCPAFHALTTFGRDQNNTIGSTSSIYRSRSSIL